ncbi:MAG: metal ABC transporter permease [Alphaproteobacteria bacterium]|nr:metal ABC transporter permease [Alphaproteobacteria bacterium]
MMISPLIDPFVDFAFMRRALATALILALGGTPLGVFMSLRRMTLVGDALGHAILPGVAVAFLLAGLSVWAMTLGGVIAAIFVALLVTFLTRFTKIKEDSAFTLVYLLSLAIGVTLLSIKGSNVNLFHLLFGNILAIDQESLILITGVSCLSLFVLAALYRRLVVEGFDPDFLKVAASHHRLTGWTNPVFFVLLMMNLVAAFQVLGTLMALGLMILPAVAARFWVRNIDKIIPVAMGFACFSAYTGLLASYYAHSPSGPAIVLVAGGVALFSALMGRVGSLRTYIAQ